MQDLSLLIHKTRSSQCLSKKLGGKTPYHAHFIPNLCVNVVWTIKYKSGQVELSKKNSFDILRIIKIVDSAMFLNIDRKCICKFRQQHFLWYNYCLLPRRYFCYVMSTKLFKCEKYFFFCEKKNVCYWSNVYFFFFRLSPS